MRRRLLLLLLAAFALAARTPPVPVYVPHVEVKDAPKIQGSTFFREREDHAIWIKRVDGEDRGRYIRNVTGMGTDPFAGPPELPPRFISFLLVVENRGDGPIEFNPLSSWLVSNKKEIQTPIGVNDVSFAYRSMGLDPPAAYERVAPALLFLPESIPPGGKISGLLVFRALDPRARRFRVDAKLSLPNGEITRFTAPYRRLTGKEAQEAQEAKETKEAKDAAEKR